MNIQISKIKLFKDEENTRPDPRGPFFHMPRGPVASCGGIHVLPTRGKKKEKKEMEDCETLPSLLPHSLSHFLPLALTPPLPLFFSLLSLAQLSLSPYILTPSPTMCVSMCSVGGIEGEEISISSPLPVHLCVRVSM